MTTIPAKDFFGGGPVTVVGNEASNDYKKSALQPPEEQQAKPSFTDSLLGSITDAAKGGLNQIKQGVNTISSGAPGQNPIIAGTEAALKVGSGAASIIQSPLAPLFAPVGAAIDAVGNAVGSIPAVQKFANSKAGEITSRVAEDVANAGNVAGTIAGVKGITKIPDTIKSGVNALTKAKDTLVGNPSETAAADIVNSYYKAVKPSVAGKTSTGQFDKYNADVTNAVDTIRQNKTKLSFEDENGTTRVGETPKTRGEFADAIGQTKKLIFDQYNELEKKTNGTGVTIQLDKAGTALDDVIKSEALKLTNPEAVKYAQEMQTRLQNPDGSYKQITPDVAQTAISNWNSSLKAFYRNPTYENASRAAIDAGVVHQIRVALDDAIHNATGENYQAIKNQYGALSAIEKDVNKAAVAQAKATGSNVSGLGKYVDVFAGGDMLGGILSLNPALFAKGAAQTGINHFFQYLNSPDRAIETMFKHAENYTNQPLRTPSTSQPTKTTTPNTTNIPDSIPPESKTSKFINTVKTSGQRGFVKNPLATTEKIHPDDLATMSDFTDYVAGSYKPSAAEANRLELDASRLWEHYFPNKAMPKSTQAIANEFGRVLEKHNFGGGQMRDDKGRFAPKGKAGEPENAPTTWSQLQKDKPDLFNTGILRKSYSPSGATDEIPRDVHSAQGHWQNYGQNSETPAKVLYDTKSGHKYVDDAGNPVLDENGNQIEDTWNPETQEWTDATIPNQRLRDNLLNSFETPKGKAYLEKVVKALPKNSDGTITAYRIGSIGDGPQSYTVSDGMAKTFSNQGTDVLPAGTPGLPKEGYKDWGPLKVNSVKIDPKGIVAWSPYDAEILVEPKYVTVHK